MESYQKYLALSEQEKSELCAVLERGATHKGGFICPTLGTGLSVPCSIEACGYHVVNSWFKNCVLCYMHQEGLQNLTTTEVAFLLKMPEAEVEEVYNGQMAKIRRKYLQEALISKGNAVTYLEGIDVCCVCDCKTNASIIREGLVFCGQDCLKAKPPFVFDIERTFMADIASIMETALGLFKSASILESVFRTPRKKLEFVVRKFAAHLSEKMFDLVSSENDFLCRKERKSAACIRSLGHMAARLRQFGTPKDSAAILLNGLRGRLQAT